MRAKSQNPKCVLDTYCRIADSHALEMELKKKFVSSTDFYSEYSTLDISCIFACISLHTQY